MTTQRQYKQAAGVQALPPGTKQRGATIQGFEGYYDDAEQRRLLPLSLIHISEPTRPY